jgi:MFS family permease
MASKWPRFETVAVASLLLGAGFGFTALATNLPLFVVSVAIWTLGEIGTTSVSPTIIADLSPVELRGLYQGIFGAAWGLSYFLGPLAGGWIFENWGSNALWVGCLVMGFVIAIGYLALSAPARRQMAGINPNPSPTD